MDGGLIDGAILGGVGMTVVTITLAILMAVMLLLGRGFRDKVEEPIPTAVEMEPIVSEEGEGVSEEVVAAIALALSLAESETPPTAPGKVAPMARRSSRWATHGRQQIMDSRGRTRKQW